MLKLFMAFSLILILSSCDVPRNRQSIYGSGYSDRTNQETSHTSAGSFYDDSTEKTDTTTPESPTTTTPTSTIPTAYQKCVNSGNQFPNTSTYFGNYFICQQDVTKTKVYLWPQNTINSQVCLIPMYATGSNSINIGEAQCQYVSSASQGVEFTLYKNRPGFENYVMNAVMIMRDESFVYPYPYTLKYNSAIKNTTAFYTCMDTAYQTTAYCQAFAQMQQYKLHTF